MNEIKKLLKEKAKAIETGQYKEAASACNAIGSEYFNQEKYDEALKEHSDELYYCELTADQLGIAVANRKIGESYTMLNNFKKALEHVKKFRDISISLKSVIEEQRAWATLGRTYFLKYQHEYASGSNNKSLSETLDRAEHAYLKALQLLLALNAEIKPIELAEMKCRLLLNLGLVHETRGDCKGNLKYLKYVKEALDIASQKGLYEDIYRCAYTLGTMYQKLGKCLEANEVLQKALNAAKKLHNKILTCEVLLSKSTNLISLKKFNEARECLKSAYKLRTTNNEDHEKIIKALKVCVGIERYEKKLNECKIINERKTILEKIADGLSSITCYKLAIEYYHLTLDCMGQDDSFLFKKAPLYFSLAQTYQDDGNVTKALEYFKKEFECNKGKPVEQIETAWKMAEILDDEKRFDESEVLYSKAVSLAKKAKDQKLIYNSLNKLLSFYKSVNKKELSENVKRELEGIKYTVESDDETEVEESQDPFDDIDLSDLSDSSEEQEEITSRKRTKKIETKVNEKGETPLHQACINGSLTMVKRLVESGHSVNVRDYAGWTPLHEACNYGFYDIVEYLLENGADINDPGGPNCKGITALHDAASCGNLDVMQLLISKGASVTALDENGETALEALLEWKARSFDLDDVTLRQCKAVEEELRSKMAEAGVSLKEKLSDRSNSPTITRDESSRSGQKRNRSPSLNSDNESDDYDIDNTPPYININNDENQDDAKGARNEYKSVMEKLRRSAATVHISPVKSQVPKSTNEAPLVDESEVVHEWLIKDTNNIPQAKRKKRRLNKLKVRTSKRIDDFLVNSDSADEKEKNNYVIDDSSNESVTPAEFHDISTISSSKRESPKRTFCLRVNIANKLILVPIPDDDCTVQKLQEEASTRYHRLDGRKPHLFLIRDGAILSDNDKVKEIFSNNEEVLTTIERWDEPSLEEKYVQLCSKRNVTASSAVKKCFNSLQTSNELDCSNCSWIPPSHLNLIFITMQNYKSLGHLNFSGIPLNSSNMSELVNCIPSFTALVSLKLCCCSLNSQSIKILLDYIDDHASKDLLPCLKELDLSYNLFPTSMPFSTLFKLNSLVSLNLSSCSLNSTFFSRMLLEAIKVKPNLEELNVSGNTFSSDDISNFLYHLPRQNLKKINLSQTLVREVAELDKEVELGSKLQTFLCGGKVPYLNELILNACFLTDSDLNLISDCLSCCPLLQFCDLSANVLLSSCSIHNFFNKLYENNIDIIYLNIVGTCQWKDQHINDLLDCLKLKTLKHLSFDNCSEATCERIRHKWVEKWGNKAVSSSLSFTSDNFFCELKAKQMLNNF